jgi:geranylgeranylglycerol-phosphate geranylgeranyltransferase
MKALFETLFQLFRLSRAVNSAALALLYVAAFRYFGGEMTVSTYLRGLTWLLISLVAYGYNDVLDVDVDVHNRPLRPIPSGAISRNQAGTWVVLLTMCSLLLTFYAWGRSAFWPLIGLTGSIAYSRVIRCRSAVLSNIVAAFLVTTVAASAEPNPLYSSSVYVNAFLFCIILAREFQKDLMDAPGDTSYRSRCYLIQVGPLIGRMIYASLLLTSCLFLLVFTSAEHSSDIYYMFKYACLGLLLTAIGRFVMGLGNAREQTLLTKGVAYITVALLLSSVHQ